MFVVELIFRLTFTGGLRSGDMLEGGRRQSVPRVARGTWQSVVTRCICLCVALHSLVINDCRTETSYNIFQVSLQTFVLTGTKLDENCLS